MGKVCVYPFERRFLKDESVTTLEEFRDWVYDEGWDFYHGLTVAQLGDVMVFAWIEKEAEWLLVGDAVVKLNEASKEAEKRGLSRRIVARSVRTYARSVSLRELNKKPSKFVKLSPEEYLMLLQKTVT